MTLKSALINWRTSKIAEFIRRHEGFFIIPYSEILSLYTLLFVFIPCMFLVYITPSPWNYIILWASVVHGLLATVLIREALGGIGGSNR
jgi:hypothetical protein